MKKKLIAIALMAVMTASLFAGCGSSDKPATSPAPDSKPESSTEGEVSTTESSEPAAAGSVSYPIEGGGEVSYWVELNGNVAANYQTLGDTPFGKALSEQTGITINYQHPASGQAKEQFNLLIASGDMPDIVEADWMTNYPGGPVKAISDGVIHSLNELMVENGPDLGGYLEANPNLRKMAVTDNGDYYAFPFIRGDIRLCSSQGPIFRGDWLTDLGLEVPTTVAEWEVALQGFKDEKGATAPYTYANWNKGSDPVLYAYNTTQTWHIEDGKAVYGPVQPGYKEYLATMADWYQKGLIDPDLPTVTSDILDSRMLNGDSGVAAAYSGSGLGSWNRVGKEKDPNFQMVGAPFPTVDGSKPAFAALDNQVLPGGSAVITTNAKDPVLAAKLLNYGYSEAGHMLFNFGVEGESYTMENGEAIYTDEIMKNPEGRPVNQAMGAYIRAAYSGPMVQDMGYQNQYFETDAQKEAAAYWADTDMPTHKLPPITPTPEESDVMGPIMSEITTYMDEMTYKFILGTESLDNYDKYVETINNMGLQTAIDIQNAALERYNAR